MKILSLEKLFTVLLVLTGLSFFVFVHAAISNVKEQTTHQTAPKTNTEELETYTYVITEVNESGLYGDSLNDDTGIYIDQSTIKGMNLTEGNKIAVSFPKDDYETITKVIKLE